MSKRPKTSNPEIFQVTQYIDDRIAELVDQLSFSGGTLIEGLTIGTGDTPVNHKLRRRYRGYWVVDRNANAAVYTSASFNPRPEDQLILKASTSVQVSLWVF
ncbi:MAG: hypothetical protein E6R03_02320 [Hyphomicrobiaceae bacterium]|nr:MAG: hypothetical protein E6R03_02320 [Hyphomicrobiaceae bacterium]